MGATVPLDDPDRLARLRQTALMDTSPEEAFDRLTRQVGGALRVPTALLSLLDDRRQFFKSAIGLPEPWASCREIPLSHSFCRCTVEARTPFVVTDSRGDPGLRDSPAVTELGVVAYLGFPLVTSDGFALGALCAIGGQPRHWTEGDVVLVRDLAACAVTEIELRAAVDELGRRLQDEERERRKRYRAEEEVEQCRAELRRANQAKDRLLAMLAHELRNPLTPIRAALHVMRRARADSSTWQRSSETVERQVAHMAHLTDDLLDVSRLTSGRIRLRRERLDLCALVREVVGDYQETAGAASVALNRRICRWPLWVRADATRLAQVMENLLSNAIKFTPAGGRICVRVNEDPDRHLAAVTVRDTGLGIHPDLLPDIFESFTQADRSLDRSQGGLGLGLALVKGLVALHRGEVRAYSAGPGRGAEFTFLIPQEAAPNGNGEPGLPLEAAGPLRVLLIDDSRDTAETLCDLLELSGHQVRAAGTGEAGLEAARQFQPDVVLCDIGLPGMDGYEVARRLREDPRTSSARLIAITGYGGEDDRRRSRDAGFQVHLTKPVDPDALQRLLAELQG